MKKKNKKKENTMLWKYEIKQNKHKILSFLRKYLIHTNETTLNQN
jgi:hypothetical protein